jgi:hypothetical protein
LRADSIRRKKATRERKEESKNNREFTHCYFIGVCGTRNEVCELCFKELFSKKRRFLDRVVSKKNINLWRIIIPGKNEKDALPNDLLNILSIFSKFLPVHAHHMNTQP